MKTSITLYHLLYFRFYLLVFHFLCWMGLSQTHTQNPTDNCFVQSVHIVSTNGSFNFGFYLCPFSCNSFATLFALSISRQAERHTNTEQWNVFFFCINLKFCFTFSFLFCVRFFLKTPFHNLFTWEDFY